MSTRWRKLRVMFALTFLLKGGLNQVEGRITRKIVYEIFVISKSQDFFERFLGFLRDFWRFFDEFLRDF